MSKPPYVEIIAEARRLQVEYNAEQLATLWGLREEHMFVHLWLAYCNYISLLYQDTKNEKLVDAAITSFRNAYYLLVGALCEEGAREPGMAEILNKIGFAPVRLKPARAAARPTKSKRTKKTR